MKWSFLLFSSFLCLQAIAQYPATGNKMRLGWQTTGDGLVYRGAIGDTATLDPSGLNNAWMLLDTANGNLYAYRAKAWRLVSGGGGGGGLTMPFDSVTFNVNETDASLRELKYSEEKGYLQYGGQDSVQIPLLPGIWYVRNDTSVAIPKGTVLRATGTLGASGRIKVKHMIANGSIDAMYILGIAMQDIAVGADGYAMSQGKIRQINTQAYSEGAVLYADVDTLGGLTQTEPTGSNLKLPIAFVVHSASNGTLAVRVSPGTYLRDLHDVYITSPASNASLYYNTSESVWRDTGAAVLVADTATMLSSYISNADTSVFARDFQISGTTNYIPKFTGANTIGNSVLFDNGTNISLGSTNPISNGANSRWLTLYGSTGYSGGIVYSVADTALAYHYLNADAAGKHLRHYANSGYGQTFFTNGSGTARMTISAAGDVTIPNAAYMATNSASNVGIGTESTTYKLDLNDQRQGGGITGMRISTYYYPGILFESALRSNNGKVILNDFANGYGTGSLQSAMILQSPGAVQFSTGGDNIRTTIDASGNIGIATSSPSRPLHVNANSSMIIPSGATGTRPASGANGDIRYSTTFNNIEFYDGARGLWERPLVGTVVNNKVAFASGDTLTSNINFHWDNATTKLGIGNAAPDSTLTVTGGIRTTTSIRTGSDAMINGIRVGRGGGNHLSSVAIGDRALNGSNQYGYNVAVGLDALLSQTSGYYNIAIGPLALKDNTNQFNLIAIGLQALEKNSTGYYNVAVGSNVLGKNTSGNNNAGFGHQALFENVSGAYNIALGALPLYSNTTGSYNIAIGSEALKSNSSAEYNAAIGTQAMFANTTGANNFALGAFAFRNNTDGANNTIIGNEAGRYHASGSNVTKLDNSILIGYDARPSATSGNTGEIVIGYQGRGNGSNTTTIGNSSTTATILPAGRLGIAITSPTARLHLPAGTASANTAPLKFTSGTNLTTPEAGAVEWNGTNVFVTNSSTTRQTVNQGLTNSATMDFPNTDAQKSSDLTIAVTGASDGDVVSLGVSNAAVNANTCYTAWVSAADTVTIRFNNYSTGAINPASATFKVFVTKF